MSCRVLEVAEHAPGRYDRVMLNQRDADPLMSYRKTSHSVYDLKYHLVRVTQYRKPVLRGEIGLRVRELIQQTCHRVNPSTVVTVFGNACASSPSHLRVFEQQLNFMN